MEISRIPNFNNVNQPSPGKIKKVVSESVPKETVTISGENPDIKDNSTSIKNGSEKIAKEDKGEKAETFKPSVKAKAISSIPEEDNGFMIAGAKSANAADKTEKTPPQKDTFIFVLNSSGETNACKPLITAAKNKGYKVKVIHFRQNSKEILTRQGILNEEDFIDGTNALHLPRLKSVFNKEIDSSRVLKLIGTPHHAYCRFAFSRAKKEGIPTAAIIDLGVPPTDFKFRHTFYKTLSMCDDVVVPNESIKKTLEKNLQQVSEKSGFNFENSKVSTGGNPGFESFRLLVEMNRAKAGEIQRELGIGKDDIVLSFSSQPTEKNGENLKTTGKSLAILAKKHPDKKIHMLLCPHPRDLHKVGLKNVFGTETGISIGEKIDILKEEVKGFDNVVIREMPKYQMEKAAALSVAVLTESSTTAYECAHSDIPAVFVRTPEQGIGGAFPKFNRIPAAKTGEKLAETIEDILENPPKGLSEELSKVVVSGIEPYVEVMMKNTGLE